MRPKYTPLFAEHTETPSGGGAAPETPAQTAAPAPAAPAPEPAKITLIDRAVAAMSSKVSLSQEIHKLTGDLATANTTLEALRLENAQLKQQNSEHEANMQRLNQALSTSEGKAQDANTAAAQMLRAKGVDPAQLPAANNDAQDTIESLNDQLTKTTDPKERFRITNKIMALEAKESN